MIEVIVVRDPDGYTDVQVFIDGRKQSFEEYVIDAGAGMYKADWKAHKKECLKRASNKVVRNALRVAFTTPPGEKYLWDDDD